MKNRNVILIMFFLVHLCFPLLSLAGDDVFAKEVEIERLLFEEVPKVITPSKKLQPQTEAPASVYVITQEDIKQSGSIHVWDALREVPGIDVATTTIGQGDVSMRGFDDVLTNKTLILVDGRSLYLPVQGQLFWELIPVPLEEIDRIEVVKGPVASLYGANANLGLINVITKTPEQLDGIHASATGGSKDTVNNAIIYGAKRDNLSYKISGNWKETNSFDARGQDALDIAKGNMYIGYDVDEDTSISLSGGISSGSLYFLSSSTLSAAQWYYGPLSNTMNYAKADFRNGNMEGRVFWNYYDSKYKTAKIGPDTNLHTVDAELRYLLDLGEKHSVTLGVGSRYDYVDSTIFSRTERNKKTQSLWDVFIQDELKLNNQFTINSAVRVDRYPLSGINVSGRIAGNYYPNKQDVYRLSIGRSFRNPTMSDNYLDLPIDTTGTGIIANNIGNEELDPETYLTVEASYEGRKQGGGKLRSNVNVFWTRIDHFVENYLTGGGTFGLDTSFRNAGRAYSLGGELALEYDLYDWLTLIESYAFNHIEYNSNVADKYFSPKHKINSGFKLKMMENKLNAKFLAHYVSSTETSLGDDGKVPNYIMANLWVGYKVKDNIEVSVSGYNILNDEHIELIGGDELGRRVLGKLEVHF